MSRRTAREVAMKLAYEKTFGCDDTYASVLEKSGIDSVPDEGDIEFAESIINGVEQHLADIDSIISECAVGWTLDRMSRVDLAILRVSIYELAYAEAASYKIAINEAVRLAKRYGGEGSHRFVNGVLSKVLDVLGIAV